MQVTKKITSKGSIIYRTMDKLPVARTCTTCKIILPASSFWVHKTDPTHFHHTCNKCSLAYMLAHVPKERLVHTNTKRTIRYRKKKKDRTNAQISADRLKKHPTGEKTCANCKEVKSFDEFYVSRGNADGLMYRCKECQKLNSRK